MPRRESSPKPQPFRLTVAEALAINQVEGLTMSRAMRRLFQDFEKSGLSHAERRAILKRRYGQRRANRNSNNGLGWLVRNPLVILECDII